MANPYEPPRSAEESLELDEDTLFIVADGSVYCRSYVDLSWACLVTGETALQQVNTVSIQCSPIWLEIIGLPMILLTSIFWPHEATRQLALVASSMWWFVVTNSFRPHSSNRANLESRSAASMDVAFMAASAVHT